MVDPTPPVEAEAILPCPWCGGVTVLAEMSESRLFVGCDTSGCMSCGPERANRDEAVASWNSIARLRVPPKAEGESALDRALSASNPTDLCLAARALRSELRSMSGEEKA